MKLIFVLTEEQFLKKAMQLALKKEYAVLTLAIAKVSSFVFVKKFIEIYALVKK